MHVAGQADGAVREGQAKSDGHAEWMSRIGEGAGAAWGLRIGGKLNIGLGLVDAFPAADPFCGSVLVVMPVAGQTVAMRTQGGAILVVGTLQARQGLIIALGVAEADGAQSMQVRVDVGQDNLMSFPGIAEHFTNGEGWEAAAQVFKAGDSEQMIVAVGGGERSGDRPKGEEAVVDDIEGFGLVSKVVLAMGSGSVFEVSGGIGVGSGLVGAGIVVIPNSG